MQKSVTGVVAVVGPCSGAIVFSSLNATSSRLPFDSSAAAAAAPSEVLL
jgi:hypothetical protein